MGSDLRTLFEAGTVAGRSDHELLEGFLAAGRPAAELAFATLVERHGPMVWRVCRDVLRESNDADDAFQATFLVLARRAGVIRKRSALGPWLYGVALRVARCARRTAARRQSQEQSAGGAEREPSAADLDRLDTAPIVHEEVARLPEKLRAPLVLCYFEGLTHDQAASQLGWPVGTVRSRLAAARDRLRPRLLRRGVGPSVAILAATGRAEATATLPAALIASTVQSALGAGAAGTVPAAVAAFMNTALWEMTLMKTMTLMVATGLAAAAVLGTVGVGYVAVAGKAATPSQDDPVPKTNAASSAPGGIEPGRGQSRSSGSNLGPGGSSARVLWARLSAAATSFELAKKRFAMGTVDADPVIVSRGHVEELTAELDACVEDLRDEVDLLQFQLEIRMAEVEAARAQLAKVDLLYAQSERLVKDKVVSSTDHRMHKADVDLRSAELAKKQAELNEVKLRIKHATRRRDEGISLAEQAKKLVLALPDPLRPMAPAPARP